MTAGWQHDEGSSSQQRSWELLFSLSFSFLFLSVMVQFGISTVSDTNVPQGGSDSLLLVNLMVVVVILIMGMLSSDPVIDVAPFDQRNVTLKYRLGSLPLNPVVISNDPCQIENTFSNASPPIMINKQTREALLSGSQD